MGLNVSAREANRHGDDERLMMFAERDWSGANEIGASYYFAIDRMYDVRYLLDRTGAIVESYAYDPYGKPLIRECAGRGDMTGDSVVDTGTDADNFFAAQSCTVFDPRGDMDDDGDVDKDDQDLFEAKQAIWDGRDPSTVKTARSLIGNPFMFQGRPHFVFGTEAAATEATVMLNDHRNRFADPMTGRWLTRDPIGYAVAMSLFEALLSNSNRYLDPMGTQPTAAQWKAGAEKMKEKCDLCIKGDPKKPGGCGEYYKRKQKCKEEVDKMIKAMKKMWKHNYGRPSVSGGDRCGGYFCWDWARGFAESGNGTNPTEWRAQVRGLGVRGGPEVHYFAKFKAGDSNDPGCAVDVDDGFLPGGGYFHDVGYWKGSGYAPAEVGVPGPPVERNNVRFRFTYPPIEPNPPDVPLGPGLWIIP